MKIIFLLSLIVLTLIFVAILLFKTLGPSLKRNNDEKIISKNGQVHLAKVISMMDTGKRQERHPEIRFKLEIRPVKEDFYEVEVTTFVSVYQVSNLVPDSIIRVQYDPKFPNSVVILK